MKNLFSILFLGVMLMGIMSCNTAPADNSAANIDTIKKMDAAFNSAKLEDAVALFTDDGEVTLMPPPPGKGSYKGKAEIEEFGKNVLSGPFHVESKDFRTEGNKVMWDFSVESDYFKKGLGVNPVTGTSEAVVENGKIKSFTPTFDMQTLNKATALRFFTLYEQKNLDAIEQEMFAPGAVVHFPTSPNPMSVAEYKQIGAVFSAAFPDAKFAIGNQIAEGDQVATYAVFSGTNTGEFMGGKPTGKAVSSPSVTWDKFKDGKIVERWIQFDQLAMMQQLGALPVPGAPKK